jgi:hypothetical protein
MHNTMVVTVVTTIVLIVTAIVLIVTTIVLVVTAIVWVRWTQRRWPAWGNYAGYVLLGLIVLEEIADVVKQAAERFGIHVTVVFL